MFKRIVDVLQAVVLGAFALTVFMLAKPAPSSSASLGETVFAATCAACHGAGGEGLVGPDLTSGQVFNRFEDRAEMIEFVGTGSGEMPPMGGRLDVGEIGAVVDFVRRQLATD
jgi:mono/diheme cytochrome c family protein